MTNATPRRVLLSIALVCTGAPLVVYCGYMQTQSRTDNQDVLAILAGVIGMCLVGVGVSLPFTRTSFALRIGLGFVFWGIILSGLVYWGFIILH